MSLSTVAIAATLSGHPENRNDAVHRIDAHLDRTDERTLAVTYKLEGILDRLRIPSPQPPRVGDRLWAHTCFEIFIARVGQPAYHELNFSPSGEWAVYAFERYREGVPLVDGALDPGVSVRSSAAHLELRAAVRLDLLSPLHARAKLSIGLSAVIEDSVGTLTYWALTHPAGQPDFHHRSAFALEL